VVAKRGAFAAPVGHLMLLMNGGIRDEFVWSKAVYSSRYGLSQVLLWVWITPTIVYYLRAMELGPLL
tara:strand:+ start:798 stop:998 length:201 start_codon:yes stop_codon:yes gene_type:complete